MPNDRNSNFGANNSNPNSGWKFFEEHIVDFFGCLLPGFSFLGISCISVVIPWAICTDHFISKASSILQNQSGSFWWIFLIIFLLLSYAIGELLIMGEVREPDRQNMYRLIRDLKKEIQQLKRKPQSEQNNYAKTLIESYALKIRDAIKTIQPNDILIELQKASDYFTNEVTKDEDKELEMLCKLTFPEAFVENQSGDTHGTISNKSIFESIRSSLERIRKHVTTDRTKLAMTNLIASNPEYEDEHSMDFPQSIKDNISFYKTQLGLEDGDNVLLYYAILKMQMEYAYDSPDSTFPYPCFYKYLILRDRTDILKYVDWYESIHTSKHRINRIKLDIQLYSPEGNAVINKNESHVRHMSSVWFGFKYLQRIVVICPILVYSFLCMDEMFTFVDYVCSIIMQTKDDSVFYSVSGNIIPVVCLILILWAIVTWIKNIVTTHIHYRRTCEIQDILGVYAKIRTYK